MKQQDVNSVLTHGGSKEQSPFFGENYINNTDRLLKFFTGVVNSKFTIKWSENTEPQLKAFAILYLVKYKCQFFNTIISLGSEALKCGGIFHSLMQIYCCDV